VIRNKPSTLQQIEESAPQLLAKLNTAVDKVNTLLSDENQKKFSEIISNLDTTTETFARRSGDMDATLRNLSEASAKLGPLAQNADADLAKFGKFSSDADALVRSPALSDLSDLSVDVKKLLGSLTALSDQLNRQPTKLLFGDRRKGYSPDGK